MTAEVLAAKVAATIAEDEKARNVVLSIVLGLILLLTSGGLILSTLLLGFGGVVAAADSIYTTQYPVTQQSAAGTTHSVSTR